MVIFLQTWNFSNITPKLICRIYSMLLIILILSDIFLFALCVRVFFSFFGEYFASYVDSLF